MIYAAIPLAPAVNFGEWFLGRRLSASIRKRLAQIAWAAIALTSCYYDLIAAAIVFLFFAGLTTPAVTRDWYEGDGMGWFLLIGVDSVVAGAAHPYTFRAAPRWR